MYRPRQIHSDREYFGWFVASRACDATARKSEAGPKAPAENPRRKWKQPQCASPPISVGEGLSRHWRAPDVPHGSAVRTTPQRHWLERPGKEARKWWFESSFVGHRAQL